MIFFPGALAHWAMFFFYLKHIFFTGISWYHGSQEGNIVPPAFGSPVLHAASPLLSPSRGAQRMKTCIQTRWKEQKQNQKLVICRALLLCPPWVAVFSHVSGDFFFLLFFFPPSLVSPSYMQPALGMGSQEGSIGTLPPPGNQLYSLSEKPSFLRTEL